METVLLLTPLARALNQSQILLALAQAGDWESFETLVQERQQALLSINDSSYLESLAQANLEAKAADIIQEIKAINRKLNQLAELSLEKTASELRQTHRANKAIDAYGR